jgi:hypothetical protein
MNATVVRHVKMTCRWLSIILFTVIFQCTLTTEPPPESSSGGTGSEIVGTAAYDSSAMGKIRIVKASSLSGLLPVISGNVFCYQRSLPPDTNWVQSAAMPRVYTDSVGGFIIKDAPPGEVVVEANDGSGNSIAQTVNIDKDSAVYQIGILAIKKTGTIAIQAQTQLPGRVRFYVGVKGTRLVVRGTKTNVEVKLDNIPCGITHTISIRVFEPIKLEIDIPNITVSSSQTQILESFQIR